MSEQFNPDSFDFQSNMEGGARDVGMRLDRVAREVDERYEAVESQNSGQDDQNFEKKSLEQSLALILNIVAQVLQKITDSRSSKP